MRPVALGTSLFDQQLKRNPVTDTVSNHAYCQPPHQGTHCQQQAFTYISSLILIFYFLVHLPQNNFIPFTDIHITVYQ